MGEQLDEHLSQQPQVHLPKGPLLIKAFLLYFVLLIPSFFCTEFVVTSIKEYFSFNFIDYFWISFSNNFLKLFIFSFPLTSCNYILQRQLFPAYQSSIIKTAMIPFFFWFSVYVGFLVYNEYTAPYSISLVLLMPNIILMCCFLIALFVLISWQIKHNNRLLFFMLLFFLIITMTFLVTLLSFHAYRL